MSDKRWRSLFSSFVSAPAIIRSHSLRRKRAGHLIRTRMACPQGRPALSDHAGHTIAPDDDDKILSNVHFVPSSSSSSSYIYPDGPSFTSSCFLSFFFVVPSGAPHLIGRARLKIILLRSIAVGVRSRRDSAIQHCVCLCVRTAATPDPNPFIQQDGASGIARLSIRRVSFFFCPFLSCPFISLLSVGKKRKGRKVLSTFSHTESDNMGERVRPRPH